MFEYYLGQSPTSDPGAYRDLFADLPTDLAGIAQITQGLIYHYFADRYHYGWQPPQERVPEINTRTVARFLATLLAKDPRPLTTARPFEQRLVGCCRDFSLLACAILRHQGKAARPRYGFAGYFVPDYWIDHVIVEIWNGERWQRFDPQIANRQDWGFDALDIPDAHFVTGGRAWQMARTEGADPDRFGLGPGADDVRGWWFLRERLQLDIAALNKLELLCWDQIAGIGDESPADQTLLDEMAAWSLDPDSTALRARCATDERWQLPTSVTCFHPIVGPAFTVPVP